MHQTEGCAQPTGNRAPCAVLAAQAVVAKVYKSLLPHQEAVGFSMAPAKACLSQKPVAGWDLQEALQTAVVKTLTGSSTGTASSSSSSSLPSTTPADPQGQLQGQQGWMCLSRHKLVGSNLLVAVPGQVSTALFAELEVVFDAGNKGILLIVHAAGAWMAACICSCETVPACTAAASMQYACSSSASVLLCHCCHTCIDTAAATLECMPCVCPCAGSLKFRSFSPCQVLQQDAKSLEAPLTLSDSDTDLLSDPSKLAAAARQLDGRPVKLLPDDRWGVLAIACPDMACAALGGIGSALPDR